MPQTTNLVWSRSKNEGRKIAEESNEVYTLESRKIRKAKKVNEGQRPI